MNFRVEIYISALVAVAAISTFVFMLVKRRGGPGEGNGKDAKKLASALHSKQAQSEILIESISDGIIVVDTEGQVSLMNSSAAQITGWPVEEAMSIDATAILKLVADEKSGEIISDEQHPFSQVLKKHERHQKTYQIISRSNKKIFVSLAISPVLLPKSQELVGAVAVLRDVSAEKSEEQKRAEFVSTASHEMRTPVAAIEGYLALALNDKVSSIDARARDYIEKAHASTQHLGKLFQDLLTSAKAEDGRLSSHPVIVEMNEFIEKLVEDLKFTAEKKGLGVELIVNTHAKTDTGAIDTSLKGKTVQPIYYVNVDPDRIREVITNIFDNAVKYTEQGKISIGLTGNNEVAQLRITDTGPGIPPEDLPHLFQKFYRVDNSATRAIGGTGLGLFICKKIVELYNGMIWADSTLGKGSTFYINLPRIETNRALQMKAKEKALPNV